MKFLFTFLTCLCLVLVACEQECATEEVDPADGPGTSDVIETPESDVVEGGDTADPVDDIEAPEEDTTEETDTDPTEDDAETPEEDAAADDDASDPDPEEDDEEETGDPTEFQKTQHRFHNPSPGHNPAEDD